MTGSRPLPRRGECALRSAVDLRSSQARGAADHPDGEVPRRIRCRPRRSRGRRGRLRSRPLHRSAGRDGHSRCLRRRARAARLRSVLARRTSRAGVPAIGRTSPRLRLSAMPVGAKSIGAIRIRKQDGRPRGRRPGVGDRRCYRSGRRCRSPVHIEAVGLCRQRRGSFRSNRFRSRHCRCRGPVRLCLRNPLCRSIFGDLTQLEWQRPAKAAPG